MTTIKVTGIQILADRIKEMMETDDPMGRALKAAAAVTSTKLGEGFSEAANSCHFGPGGDGLIDDDEDGEAQ